MKLRIKTITIFIAITICLIIIIHFVSESIILGSAIQLEQAQISSEIGRLQTEWTNELARYQTTVDSWAQKSGTSDFIKAQSANPKGSSQVINSLVNLGVNYLMLYDSSGKFIAGFGFNLTTYQQEPLPTSLVSKIQACSSIIGVTAGAGSGVLQIPTGLLIVSSAQITPSVNQPAEGDILVLARYLDADEISMLQRALQMPVSIQPYAESQSSSVPQSVTFSVPIDTNYVVGYSMIKDYNGAPAFLLGVTMSRTVYVQGVITLNYIDRLVLVSCVVFSLTIFITFEFLVLSKLSKLTNAVTKISQHNNPSERLPTKGNDEFETLTGSINKMLGEIEENNEKLQIFEKAGFHITPNLFYYPIPDTRTLDNGLWEKESELVGVDMNISQQLTLLKEVFPKFRDEWGFAENKNTAASTYDYYFNNATFGGGGDAEV